MYKVSTGDEWVSTECGQCYPGVCGGSCRVCGGPVMTLVGPGVLWGSGGVLWGVTQSLLSIHFHFFLFYFFF